MGDEPCDVGPIVETFPARAAERLLIDQYRNPADYAAACRVLHGKPEPVRFEAEGAVFGRLIGRE